MYLSTLDHSKKELFLNLARQFAVVDGKFSIEEKVLIDQYCKEMDISAEKADINMPVSEVISALGRACSMDQRKIIVFELIGLNMSDHYYHDSERTLIHAVLAEFGIDESFETECEAIIQKYMDVQDEMNTLVLK